MNNSKVATKIAEAKALVTKAGPPGETPPSALKYGWQWDDQAASGKGHWISVEEAKKVNDWSTLSEIMERGNLGENLVDLEYDMKMLMRALKDNEGWSNIEVIELSSIATDIEIQRRRLSNEYLWSIMDLSFAVQSARAFKKYNSGLIQQLSPESKNLMKDTLSTLAEADRSLANARRAAKLLERKEKEQDRFGSDRKKMAEIRQGLDDWEPTIEIVGRASPTLEHSKRYMVYAMRSLVSNLHPNLGMKLYRKLNNGKLKITLYSQQGWDNSLEHVWGSKPKTLLGWYAYRDVEVEQIHIKERPDAAGIQSTAIHELAHALSLGIQMEAPHRQARAKLRKRYKQMEKSGKFGKSQGNGPFITSYAEKSEEEYFAETFAAAMLAPRKLYERDNPGYAIVEQFFM